MRFVTDQGQQVNISELTQFNDLCEYMESTTQTDIVIGKNMIKDATL